MVMHARKQPRVNDGYTERKDAHLHQWLDRHQSVPQSQQRGNGGRYADRSPAEGSHSRHSRNDSPGSQPSPRYHNKVAYLERHKDKRGSLHLAEEKVSQYLATGSIGERAPHSYVDFDEGDRHSEHSQDGRHAAIDKDQTSSSSSRKVEVKDERDHRAEVQKSAVRVCGDWSEHISSSGKRYYYNCQTEVSQWEKPKDWNQNQSSRRPERRDSKGNGKSCPASAMHGGGERARHSSTSDHPDGRNPPSSSSSHHHQDSPYTSTPSATTQRPSDRHYVDVASRGGTAHPQDNSASRRNSATAGEGGSGSGYSHNHKGPVAQTSHSGHCSNPDLKRNNLHLDSSIGEEPPRQRQRQDSEGPGQGQQRSSQRREAIETLQELQKALDLHIKKQQSKGTSSTASSSTGTTSAQLQSQLSSLEQNLMGHSDIHHHHHHTPHPSDTSHPSPHSHNSAHHNALTPGGGEEGRLIEPDHHHHHPHHPHHHHLSNNNNNSVEEEGGHASPETIMSPGTSCHSPTPSIESPPTMPAIGTSALSVAALKSQQSVGLSPALSNYYNEKLIGHVLGWQGEQLEKQAERFRQEALQVGSLHCSHVCVELKRARSNVRTAEIQSTIHEQRKMMLAQQRSDIENLKPPTSLLPS